MNLTNLILLVDSYKNSHPEMFPPKTTKLFYYFESRGGEFKKTLVNGLQGILARYFTTPITHADVEEAAQFNLLHGEPFARESWDYIVDKYNGYLPIKIRAVPEGLLIPTHNVLFTVESTDERVPWVAGAVETILERVWYPITVGTLSWEIKQDILSALESSSDDPLGQIPFKLHDFGARGVSSHESAEIGGAAHLINFMGSDNIEGIRYANFMYDEKMAGFSIPAGEHSIITSWMKKGERDAYANIIKRFGGKYPLIAFPTDSYDHFNAVSNILGKDLKQQIIECGSMVVVRPDSGDPRKIVAETLKRLDVAFGSVTNKKGFKVLNHVRVLQGDGVNRESISGILEDTLNGRFSIDNIAFGMGGALLQKVDRDTCKFAYKCSGGIVDGEYRDIFKDPVTDPGKKSMVGELELFHDVNGYYTITRQELIDNQFRTGDEVSVLQTVYENGPRFAHEKLSVVRARSNGM